MRPPVAYAPDVSSGIRIMDNAVTGLAIALLGYLPKQLVDSLIGEGIFDITRSDYRTGVD